MNMLNLVMFVCVYACECAVPVCVLYVNACVCNLEGINLVNLSRPAILCSMKAMPNFCTLVYHVGMGN